MSALVWALRFHLSGLLAASAVGKLLSWRTSGTALRGFGVPAALNRPAEAVLIFVEAVLAVALWVPILRVPAALAISALMLVYAAVVAISLLRGRHEECNCFGAFHSETASWGLVTRDVVIACAALVLGLALAFPIAPQSAEADQSNAVIGLGLCAIALLVWVVSALARSQRSLANRVRELESQDRADPGWLSFPSTTVQRLDGAHARLDTLVDMRSATLIFVSPECEPCRGVVETLVSDGSLAGREDVLVVSTGSVLDSDRFAREFKVPRMAVQSDSGLSTTCGVHATPSAVAVEGGRIASRAHLGAAGIYEVLSRNRSRATQ
jgi:hypothetical protein